MCCGRLFGGQLLTGGCWDKTSHFCTRWSYAVRDLMLDAYPELNETRRSRVESCAGGRNTVRAHAGSWA